MNDDFGKIPDDEAIGAMLEAYRASKDARLVKNCQNGYPDICKVAKRDGVVCADYECDIDSGVRKEAEDARPVAIYQVYWGETASWTDTTPETFALVDAKYRRIVYATRDAAPSDDFRESVTQLVDDMLTAWIADLPISACGEISARANALLKGHAATAPRENA